MGQIVPLTVFPRPEGSLIVLGGAALVHRLFGLSTIAGEPTRKDIGDNLGLISSRREVMFTPDSFRQMSALRGAAILLVDDDEVVRSLCRRSLEGEGARVVQAGDGEAALSFIQECDRQLDLVITDLRMPRINGRELAEVLSIFRPTLPVLGMTGWTAEADRRLPTLVKPFVADLVKGAARLMRTRAREQRGWAEERRARARKARQLAAEMMDRQSALQQRVNLVAVARKLQGAAPDPTDGPFRMAL